MQVVITATAVMLNVPLDDFSGDLVSNSAGEVTILPELTASQLPLDVWVLAEDGPRTVSLEQRHYLRDGVFGSKRTENVNRVYAHFHLFNLDAVALGYFRRNSRIRSPTAPLRTFLRYLGDQTRWYWVS